MFEWEFVAFNWGFPYFDKVDAIEYSLRHDDGQILDDLEEADIILIGPSRTSKTPTSVYLSYNGFKTANIPLVSGCPFPDILPKMNNPVIFGLIINPGRLVEIRESRMNLLQVTENSNYTDIKTIQDECRQVKRICYENNWKVISCWVFNLYMYVMVVGTVQYGCT